MLDALDIWIIKEFYEKRVTTTWDMSKNYKWTDKKRNLTNREENKFFLSKSMMIEYRIKRFIKEGFVKIEGNGEKIFVLDVERVKISRHKFPNGMKGCLMIKNKNNKWVILEI